MSATPPTVDEPTGDIPLRSRRTSSRVSFSDDVSGEALSQIELIEHDGREADQQAHLEALAIYGEKLTPGFMELITRLAEATDEDSWERAGKDVRQIISRALHGESDNAPEAQQIWYLPEYVRDKRVILDTTEPGKFLVDNSELGAHGPGLPYRESESLDGCHLLEFQAWGTIVPGSVSEGWLAVPQSDERGATCSDAEAAEAAFRLVKCGQGVPPTDGAAAGFLLCSLAERSPATLGSVIKAGAMPLIVAALVVDCDLCDLKLAALRFLEQALDPTGSHVGEVRDTVIRLAVRAPSFISLVFGGMEQHPKQAVAVISGLVKGDSCLLNAVAAADGSAVLLDLLERGGASARCHAHILDILGGLVDASSGCATAKATIRTMTAFRDDVEVQTCGCAALSNCVPHLQPGSLRGLECGIIVVGAMRIGQEIAGIQRAGCRILLAQAVAGNCIPDDYVSTGICTVVVVALKRFGTVSGLSEDAIALLTRIATCGVEAKEALKNAIDAAAAGAPDEAGHAQFVCNIEELRKLVST